MSDNIPPFMRSIEWDEIDEPFTGNSDGMPFATHSGVLEIAGHKLRCYRLNTGQAIIHADDLEKLLFADWLSEVPTPDEK